MVPKQGKVEWFGGNEDAFMVFQMLLNLGHTWDDLVDKDKPNLTTEYHINHAFLICLVYLQMNPFYQTIQSQVLPIWITVVSGYETANHYEREKDAHGIEIAHTLRYAAGNIVAYMIHICVGEEKAREYLPEMWKVMVFERYDAYKKEHLNA